MPQTDFEAIFFPQGSRVGVLTTQPIDRMLDYKAPEGGVMKGAFVEVPLGPRKVLGVVWGEGEGSFDLSKLRNISKVLDVSAMRPEMMQFLERTATYTITPMATMLRLATRLPGLGNDPRMRKILRLVDREPDRMTPARARVIAVLEEHGGGGFTPSELAGMAGVTSSVVKGLVKQNVLIEEATPHDLPFERLDPNLPSKDLSQEQTTAANDLKAGFQNRSYGTTLLKGVTGSGKTEVYLEAVAQCLREGRQALVLLPEIALTVEFLTRVEARFGARPAEWHSGVSQVERRRAWKAISQGQADLVVGARSALFLPFRDLGLIVVDEEHDGSYKQEDGALYHARDMAVLRASLTKAQVVLATATPSLETWANAEAGKYKRINLNERFGTALLPDMKTTDLRENPPPRNAWISERMAVEVKSRLENGEQSLLFLNRRGYAPLTQCRKCGEQVGCPDCDSRMVEHRFLARLMCHQCGFSRPMPEDCPKCEAEGSMNAVGPGVERLAEEASERFPGAKIAILSSDLADTARKLKERIDLIASGAADIIIGTQMVAKGHNFPLLTLVGVIDADLGLHGGDLRAAEKSFQLIRQVAGRAGRADKPGLALLQTYQPDHPVIQAIVSGDEEDFWRAEAASRQEAGAPPYGRMAGIVVSGPDEAAVFDLAGAMARKSRAISEVGAQLFGPAPAPIARIRGNHRVRLLIKSPKGTPLQPAIRSWISQFKLPANLRVTIDIDPQSFY